MSQQSARPTTPRVTFIVPTIEIDEHLREALSSLRSDAGFASQEILVVFDGVLPDERPAWLDVPCTRIISTGSRGGAARAINLGIEQSDSEYIGRLDADDRSVPGRLHEQISYLDANPTVVAVGTNASIIDELGNHVREYPRTAGSARTTLLTRNPFVHSSLMMRRSALHQTGFYDVSCIRMQDYELLLRLAIIGQVAILDKVLVQYRVHSSQTSSAPRGFFPLMGKISQRRLSLARELQHSIAKQYLRNFIFTAAQAARYLKLRKAGYQYHQAASSSRGTDS